MARAAHLGRSAGWRAFPRVAGWGAVDAIARAGMRPVDGTSVAVFRIGFGLLALFGVARFFAYGWIDEFYVQPEHHFTYWGFGWVQPWSWLGLTSMWMQVHFAAMGVAALAIAVGYRTRWAAAAYFLLFTYVELLDQATYLNHYYWVSLAALLMVFMPLSNRWSLDARSGRVKPSRVTSAWVLWALRAQLAAVYVFAGLAKLNPDWLFHAQPLSIWLANHDDMPLIGPLLALPATAYVFSWAGAAFDCTIVGWLLWRRSRPFAYVAVVAFHTLTWLLFPIGVFPWLMIAGTTLFFAPDWPRRLLRRVQRGGSNTSSEGVPSDGSPVSMRIRLAVLALGVFAVVQVAMPLRHYAYTSNVRWSEDGYRFSWRVMLSEKAGFVKFEVTDPASGDRWAVSPAEYFTPMQVRVMSTQPDMILQAAHVIRDDFAARGLGGVEVRVDAVVAFNGRAPARLVDPEVDLAATPYRPGPKDWVLGLEEDGSG